MPEETKKPAETPPLDAPDELLEAMLSDLGRVKPKEQPKAAAAAAPPAVPPDDKKPADGSQAQAATTDAGTKPDDAAAAKPPTDTPPNPDAAPPKEKEEPKTRVSKRKAPEDLVAEQTQRILDAVEKKVSPAQAAAPKEPDKPKDDQPAIDTSDWDQDEKDEIEFLQYAAGKDKSKYGDLPKKFADARGKIMKYVEEGLASDPTRTFDESDEEFQKFVEKTVPKIPDRERRRLETRREVEAVMPEVSKPADDKLAGLETTVRRMDATPRIRSAVQGTISETDRLLKEDTTISQAIEAINANPEAPAAKVAASIKNHFAMLTARFLESCAGLRELNNTDPDDVEAFTVVNTAGEFFAQNADEKSRTRDGKTFLPLEKFMSAHAADPRGTTAKHWTLDDKDIVAVFALNAQNRIAMDIKERLESAKLFSTFKPQPPAGSKPPQAQPKPQDASSPPAVVPSAMPGMAKGDGASPAAGAMAREELVALGFMK